MIMKTYIISILVVNEPGVLLKLCGLFVRRGFNINTIAVGATEKKGFSRIIISLCCDKKTVNQLEKQLTKSIDVVGISDLTENTIVKELCLIKLKITSEKQKEQILKNINLFDGKIIDINNNYAIVQVTDAPNKIKHLIEVLSCYAIVKITRSGTIAIKNIENNNKD